MFKKIGKFKGIMILAIAMSLVISILCYCTITFAMLQQNGNVSNQIIVEAINLEWTDGFGNKIDKIPLSAHISSGEKVELPGDNLSIKNGGTKSYARVKITTELDGVQTDKIAVTLSQTNGVNDWVQGADGYYYFCRTGVYNGEVFGLVSVVTDITFSDSFKNSDAGKSITIKLIAEAIDSRDDAYITAWGNNPPDEWFAATSHSRN